MSNSKHPDDEPITLTPLELLPKYESPNQELALLDLYAGCGGMSTGLCLGAKLASVNLMTVITKTKIQFLVLIFLVILIISTLMCSLLVFRNGLLIITALHARV